MAQTSNLASMTMVPTNIQFKNQPPPYPINFQPSWNNFGAPNPGFNQFTGSNASYGNPGYPNTGYPNMGVYDPSNPGNQEMAKNF